MLNDITLVMETFDEASHLEKMTIVAVGMAVIESLRNEPLEETQEYIKELHEAANS